MRNLCLITFAMAFCACNTPSVPSGESTPYEASLADRMVSDIDGNTYRTVIIGGQEWLADNLKSTRYANGDTIAELVKEGVSGWYRITTGACSSYEEDQGFVETYGLLYNWWAVSDKRNICPQGWHVASIEEWEELFEHLGGKETAGGKMKVKGTAYWCSPNEEATNKSGFNGLPSGGRGENGGFWGIEKLGSWWTSSENGRYNARSVSILHSYGEVLVDTDHKRIGFACRCIRD